MITGIKLIMAYVVLSIIPYILGKVYLVSQKKRATIEEYGMTLEDRVRAQVYGWMFLFAFFEVSCIPFIFAKARFTLFIGVFLGMLAVLLAWCVWYLNGNQKVSRGFEQNGQPIQGIGSSFVSFVRSILGPKRGLDWVKEHFIWVLAAGLVVFQVLFVLIRWHEDLDDSFYLGEPGTILDTNRMYLHDSYTGQAYQEWLRRYMLSPLQVFYAMVCKVFGLHPMVVGHILFAALFIILSYKVLYLLGGQLFSKDRIACGVFLFFCGLLNIWGNASVCTQSTFLLFRIWQGKALLANAFIPLFFVLVMEMQKTKKAKLFFFWMLAASMISSMGIALGGIMIGLMFLILSIKERRLCILLKGLVCAIPCVILSILYLCMNWGVIPF